jgi:hypothetical protein
MPQMPGMMCASMLSKKSAKLENATEWNPIVMAGSRK